MDHSPLQLNGLPGLSRRRRLVGERSDLGPRDPGPLLVSPLQKHIDTAMARAWSGTGTALLPLALMRV